MIIGIKKSRMNSSEYFLVGMIGLFLLSMSPPAWGLVTGFTPCSALPSQSPTPTATFCSTSVNPPEGYVGVNGMMTGSTSFGPFNFGTYNAPITLFYPDPVQGPACSGTGIVDFINNTANVLRFYDGLPFATPLQSGRILLGNNYIADRGHVLASVQYQRILFLGVNIIDLGKLRGFYPAEAGIPAPAGSEALATLIVMKDAANFIRNLGTYLPGACNSTMAIAHGYSQSGAHLRVLLSSSTFGPGTFDGASSLSPPWRNIPPPGNSGATPATSGKHIGINVETDILFTGGENLRADTDNYRVYEVAGVSHVPTELAPVANSRQIPARISPVLRSMMDQLIAWVDGISIPPPSEYLDAASTNPACALVTNLDMLQLVGTPAGPDPFLDCPSLRDEDNGNVLSGGVRLPHVVTEIDGELVGAPLGNYHGVETETPFKLFGTLPNTSLAILLTGVFTRFTDQDLAERYGVEHQGEIKDVFSGFYLGRVASAAEYAESRGWISEEEKIAYIQTAQDCSAGKDMTLIAQDLLACHGL